MAIKTYEGTAYKQSRAAGAPWIISFVSSAEDLLAWAGIPRRATSGLVGFQRGLDGPRAEKAKVFFNTNLNQSPTALVVGVHPQSGSGRPVNLEFLEGDNKSTVRRCKLVIDFAAGDLDVEAAVAQVKAQIINRLGTASAVAVNDLDADAETAEGEASDQAEILADASASGLDGGDAEPDEQEDEIELGRSVLRDLLANLGDEQWTAEHAEDIRDLAKPATIIDGQHRVVGAQLCERNIPFAVCAIFDCSWPEQVFQFTVVNYTAKGIPDQFITANAALSLTKDELTALQSRLVQAGVKVIEYELMKVVEFDPRSPFHGLVNLSEKSDPNKIGYNTMVRVARRWYDAKHPAFLNLLPQLYPDMAGKKNKAKRLDRWKREDWGGFFVDFWRVIHGMYSPYGSHEAGHSLWDVGHSNLIVAIVLYELQEAFLKNLNAQDEEFFIPKDPTNSVLELREKLRKRAEKFVEWIPVGFFGSRWGWSSLSIGPGRAALSDALTKFVDSKGSFQYANSSLVTGKTAG
jgi:hypothetical protein